MLFMTFVVLKLDDINNETQTMFGKMFRATLTISTEEWILGDQRA